jgi:hypothetical protein
MGVKLGLSSKSKNLMNVFVSLCAGPKLRTDNLTANVTNLEACESYIFAVGIIGPFGLGPLSVNPSSVVTRFNRNAAPKNLKVYSDPHNETHMIIQWHSSCPAMSDKIGYMV